MWCHFIPCCPGIDGDLILTISKSCHLIMINLGIGIGEHISCVIEVASISCPRITQVETSSIILSRQCSGTIIRPVSYRLCYTDHTKRFLQTRKGDILKCKPVEIGICYTESEFKGASSRNLDIQLKCTIYMRIRCCRIFATSKTYRNIIGIESRTGEIRFSLLTTHVCLYSD